MPTLTIEDDGWTHIDGTKLDSGMTIRRKDEGTQTWTEGKVGLIDGYFCLVVGNDPPLRFLSGDNLEIISEDELYQRAMNERNRLIVSSREKPWLPFDEDGE